MRTPKQLITNRLHIYRKMLYRLSSRGERFSTGCFTSPKGNPIFIINL